VPRPLRLAGAGDEPGEFAYRGRVLGNGDGRASGVRVEIGVVDGDRSEILARAVSDATGRFEGSVSIPAEFADLEGARLFARIEGEGYAPRRARYPIARTRGAAEFHLSILGAHLAGRVMDSDGQPVNGASVELRTAGLAGIDAGATSNKDGEFEVLWVRPGTYRLNAHAREKGRAELDPIVLVGDVESEELEIRLRRDDRLAGLVEDLEGRPLEGVEVWAFPPYLAGRSEESLFVWRQGPSASGPRGERSGACISGRDGTFSIEGLEPGSYWLAPADELGPGSGCAALGSTGDTNVALVVGRWWLELRPPSPMQGVLFCAPVTASGAGSRLAPAASGESAGTQIFAVQGGRSYVCGWMDAAHAVREETVRIPWDRPRSVVDVAAGEALAPATLAVSILTLDREDEQRARTVHLYSTGSGVELWRWTQGSTSGPEILSAGSYRLNVTIAPTHSFRDGLPGFESLLVEDRRIEIRAGEAKRIEIWR
jgi:hypothetical protein